jgi:ribonuclease HII
VPDDPLERPPWGLPADAALPPAELAGELRSALDAAGVEVRALATKTVTVARFNEGVERTDSKAAVLFEAAMDLLAPWLDVEGPVTVVIDRHGGRKFYSEPLAGRFPDRFHWVETEEKGISAYVFPADDVRISFEVNADARHRPVALASMAAKYVRERWMGAFNAWFASHDPDLAPTAGYVTDARRWLVESAEMRARIGVTDEALVRVR